MKFFITTLFLFSTVFQIAFAEGNNSKIEHKTRLDLLSEFKSNSINLNPEFTGRKISGIVFSTFIPGAGQYYLGEELKGTAFTLAFYGCAVAAVLANTNMTGRDDRIKVLTKDYLDSKDYYKSEAIWQTIQFEVNNRKWDYRRRQIYMYSAIGVWVLNMLDVIFITEDNGASDFVLNGKTFPKINLALDKDFSGVALQFNLP